MDNGKEETREKNYGDKTMIENRKYLLTIRYEFQACDDVKARQIARDYILGEVWEHDKIDETQKLQNVFENKPPRNVEL